MSPYEVKLLLHIYPIAEPLPQKDTQLLRETLHDFKEKGFIVPLHDAGSGWEITKAGITVCNMICSLDLDCINICKECGQLIE